MQDDVKIPRKRGQKISAGDTDKLIGLRIRIVRNMSGKTQDDLAKYLGLTLQQIQKYENGKNKVHLCTAIKIADFFQTATSNLIPSKVEIDQGKLLEVKFD